MGKDLYAEIRPVRMISESEIRKGLETNVFGKQDIFVYDETGSTNDIAYRLGTESYPEGTIVIADSQTGGRGRHGKFWVSIPGRSLSFSLILRPAINITSAPGITLAAAVALSDTLHGFSIHNHRIKWPNDILINSKKICGILTELKSSHGNIDFIITGIGINTGPVSDLMPPDLKAAASSINDETGVEIDRVLFLQKLLLNFEKRYYEFVKSGLTGIIHEWERNSGITGCNVAVNTAAGRVTGVVTGILEDGSLALTTESGSQSIISGEIEIL